MKHNQIKYNEIKLQEKSNTIKRRSMNKRFRTAFTHIQLIELQAEFANNSSLTSSRRKKISKRLSLDEYTIKVWFQNQRQKNRKKRIQPTTGTYVSNTPDSPQPVDDENIQSERTKQVVVSYVSDRPESPQPIDDDYIQSEVEEELEQSLILSKKLRLDQPQTDRDIENLCQKPNPSEESDIRLTEEKATYHQPDKQQGYCLNLPLEHVEQPPQQVVYPVGTCSWGQVVHAQQQLGYRAYAQQNVQPWHQQHQIYQQQVPALNFQHQLYAGHMAQFMYQFNPYAYNQQQYSYISQQQIPWHYLQHQYIPQQTSRQQYDPSEDDEKLDIAQIIQNTIHYLS